MLKNKVKQVIKFQNMSDFLKGQSSKIITSISENDEVTLVLKNGKPKAIIMSNDRFERLVRAGINVLDF